MIVSNFHIILNAFQRQMYLLFDSAEHERATPDFDCIYSWRRALTNVVENKIPVLQLTSCYLKVAVSLQFLKASV